jgi:hypothetical protein
MAARALESGDQLLIDPVETGRDHDVKFGGRNRGRYQKGGHGKPA